MTKLSAVVLAAVALCATNALAVPHHYAMREVSDMAMAASGSDTSAMAVATPTHTGGKGPHHKHHGGHRNGTESETESEPAGGDETKGASMGKIGIPVASSNIKALREVSESNPEPNSNTTSTATASDEAPSQGEMHSGSETKAKGAKGKHHKEEGKGRGKNRTGVEGEERKERKERKGKSPSNSGKRSALREVSDPTNPEPASDTSMESTTSAPPASHSPSPHNKMHNGSKTEAKGAKGKHHKEEGKGRGRGKNPTGAEGEESEEKGMRQGTPGKRPALREVTPTPATPVETGAEPTPTATENTASGDGSVNDTHPYHTGEGDRKHQGTEHGADEGERKGRKPKARIGLVRE